MLTVDHYEIIRRKVRDGISQREVAKELGHSRNTVAKAIKYAIPPGYRLSQPRSKNVLSPFTHIIDTWLEADKKVRRKQRMQATKMYYKRRSKIVPFGGAIMYHRLTV